MNQERSYVQTGNSDDELMSFPVCLSCSRLGLDLACVSSKIFSRKALLEH